MAYIPNLGYGSLTKESRKVANTMSVSARNCQDEHNCFTAALDPLVQISKQGGIHVTVRGQQVVVKVWINFIWVISKEQQIAGSFQFIQAGH
jgi:hypothetical protein